MMNLPDPANQRSTTPEFRVVALLGAGFLLSYCFARLERVAHAHYVNLALPAVSNKYLGGAGRG